MCHHMRVEVRGKLEQVSFLPPPHGSQEWNSSLQLGSQHLSLLNHLSINLSLFAKPILR